jgi:hypothetical protein
MRVRLTPARQNQVALLLLGFFVLGLLIILHERWTLTDWRQPQDIFGDPLEIFSRVKLAAEQPLQPFAGFSDLQRLGAPFHADWSSYPAPDSLVFFLTGQLSRVTGVFAAVKLVAAIFSLLNAFSFYLCARHLRWRPEWAIAGAVLFAFSNYNVRWGVTLSFNQTFTLPPLILLCSHAAKLGPVLPAHGRRWLWLGGLLGTWLGLGNPYLGFFAGLLASSTLALALVRRTTWLRLQPLVCFLLALIGVFLLANLKYALNYFETGNEGPLIRNYAGSLIYALKPIDWLIPPQEHSIAWAARLGLSYANQTKVLGDFFPGYLGVVGIIGLVGLLIHTLRRLAARPARPVPDAALGLVLVVGFAAAGSINSLLALGGLDIFRASQRISILVNIWVLLFLLGRLQLQLRTSARWVTMAVAAAIAAFGWWEQTPRLRHNKYRDAITPKWEAVQKLTQQLEQELGAGAMIFQLPVRQFPEAGPIQRMADYEHFQPFLAQSSLRFSYGPLGRSRELGWQQFVTRMPAEDLITHLEASGFSAIWINTRAYADEGEKMARDLIARHRAELVHTTGAPVRVIRLQPAKSPGRPDLDDLRIHRAWAEPSPNPDDPALLAINGWYPLEQDGQRRWRWAAKRGEVGIWWPGQHPKVKARLIFKVTVLRDNVVELRQNGKSLLHLSLTRGEVKSVEIPVTLSGGSNRLVWLLRGEPSYPPGGDSRELGFMIENLQLVPTESGR